MLTVLRILCCAYCAVHTVLGYDCCAVHTVLTVLCCAYCAVLTMLCLLRCTYCAVQTALCLLCCTGTAQTDSAVQVGFSRLSGAEGEEELPSRSCRALVDPAESEEPEVPVDREHRKDDQMSAATAAALAQSTNAAATQQTLLDMSQHEQDELLNFSG